MKDFHTDNGGEFLSGALHRRPAGRAVQPPRTRSRACRKNANAHCEQQNWTHARRLFGRGRFGHPALAAPMQDRPAQEWSPFANPFKPTFKPVQREKKDGKTRRFYEAPPPTPQQRLLHRAAIPEATRAKVRNPHAILDPFGLKKNMEIKLQKRSTALGNLNREATMPERLPPPATFGRESTRRFVVAPSRAPRLGDLCVPLRPGIQ